MRCSTVRTLLDDHVDGVLPPDRSEQVRLHLDACPECEDELELLRAATAPLDAWGDLEPPIGCFDRILERIEALPPEMHVPASPPTLRFLRGGARWLVTSGVAAAAVLAAAVALDRAGDTGVPQERPAFAEGGVSRAGVPGLRPGEIPLMHTGFAITEDLEQRDGLRRRRSPAPPDLPADLAAPVGYETFGGVPR